VKFLRTASTGRLLAVLAGLALAAAAGGAIAAAASGPGPVPKHRTLAAALHKAITAPAVKGVSARITFTNNLIDASNLQGTDPLVQGASGRLWVSSAHRMRLELQSGNGDAQIVVNKRSFWVSDPAQHVVYEGTLPATKAKPSSAKKRKESVPSVSAISKQLASLAKHLNLSGAIPGDIAGQAAYTVRVSPKHDGGLLGNVQAAWDAVRGVPLRFAVYAKGNSTPVLALKVSNISYGTVPASTFAVTPPSGSKVVKVSSANTGSASKATSKAKHARHAEASGVKAVAAKLPFKLAAPKRLIALPRQSVKLLDWGGKPAALVTYGQGLGGIVVIERAQAAGAGSPLGGTSSSGGEGRAGFSLPTVSINGATGTELDTALGTVLQFARSGVGYTVLGSVPPFAAEKAARAL
jgi:outer membrane lipoprotein-sorting protein